jgi:hypothetical protein
MTPTDSSCLRVVCELVRHRAAMHAQDHFQMLSTLEVRRCVESFCENASEALPKQCLIFFLSPFFLKRDCLKERKME